jgi:hypothetical protein
VDDRRAVFGVAAAAVVPAVTGENGVGCSSSEGTSDLRLCLISG